MTTRVLKLSSPVTQALAPVRKPHALVGLLTDTTPDQAITRLQKAGILAIRGADSATVLLIGYRADIASLLDDYRHYGTAHKPSNRYTLGRLAKLRS